MERSAELGIDFVHRHFGTGERYMPETFGSGLALLDANGDGRLDVYLVQGAPLGAAPEDPTAVNRLYVQQEDGRFRDETAAAGVGDRGFGMGAAWGDVDADGDVDLYVANFAANVLYLNRGDGRFEDGTDAGGVGSALWSTSTGFFDADEDDDLDLFVVNYVDFGLDNHKFCGDPGRKLRTYCHPDVYEALPDQLYLNDGHGRFREVGAAAGLPRSRDGKGLGLAFGDLDGDGHTDVFVANDSTMNYLLLGDGQGRFLPSALMAGVGYNAAGVAEAGMGTQIGDMDGDGLPDVFLTHFAFETNTFYRNLGGGMFRDDTEAAGLATPSRVLLGFGTVLLDHDADGDLDLFVTNGHIIDNIEELGGAGATYRQPTQLFDNLGDGSFKELPGALESCLDRVGRGAAAGDLDGDGALDIVVNQNDGPALVLLNRYAGRGHALVVRLRGPPGNLHGFGAWVELRAGERRQTRQVHSASSYQSQGTADLHFGLGQATRAEELTVHWPSGKVDRHGPLDAGFVYTVALGSKDVEATPFRSRR